jgi:hypothetical protein
VIIACTWYDRKYFCMCVCVCARARACDVHGLVIQEEDQGSWFSSFWIGEFLKALGFSLACHQRNVTRKVRTHSSGERKCRDDDTSNRSSTSHVSQLAVTQLT